MTSDSQKTNYDIRYRRFIKEINKVSKMKPKGDYLYKLMDTVPFKDLETAILMAQIDYEEAVNDNRT